MFLSPFLFVAYAAVAVLAAGHSSPRSLSPDSRQSNCITCPTTPACDCPAAQQCLLINRSCTACASFQCIAARDTSSAPASTSSASVNCIQCPAAPICPACPSNQSCILIARSCLTCATAQCISTNGSTSSSSGSSSSSSGSGNSNSSSGGSTSLPGPTAASVPSGSNSASASGPSQSGTGTGAALRLTYGSSVIVVPGLAALALLVLS
ncbi:hypothetical protein B0H13DRAFT_1995294 [Mycena leptocephala]|nr:hypothetical protein B0H13DRAFT_1995294 [Mycena leptocephala]